MRERERVCVCVRERESVREREREREQQGREERWEGKIKRYVQFVDWILLAVYRCSGRLLSTW